MQFSGINGVLYYTPQILEQAGVGYLLSNLGLGSTSSSFLISAVTTLLMLPCIAVAMRLMDISGRRYISPLYHFLLTSVVHSVRNMFQEVDVCWWVFSSNYYFCCILICVFLESQTDLITRWACHFLHFAVSSLIKFSWYLYRFHCPLSFHVFKRKLCFLLFVIVYKSTYSYFASYHCRVFLVELFNETSFYGYITSIIISCFTAELLLMLGCFSSVILAVVKDNIM